VTDPAALAPTPASTSPIATLFPGYFALVMATGIVAIASAQQGLDVIAEMLYIVAAVAYVVLGVMLTARVVWYRTAFTNDLISHARGFAFLTVVAGTNVLGSASGIIHGWWDLAWILWWLSIALWVVLLYSTLIAVVIRADKPVLGAGINGTWFLVTVSTQSIVVLGALLLERHPSDTFALLLVALFCVGLVLYLIVMTMVFLRWTFSPLDPQEIDPPAWIAAGAVAITVLAGSNLVLSIDAAPRLARLEPFIEGLTVLAWATATFWLPVMVAIGVWRHLANRVPLRYHPSYWGLVFPIGMYSASTYRMLAAVQLDALAWVPKVALAAAFVAWSAAFVGLVHRLSTTVISSRTRRN
jgi:tellurite resistance protein TehA-like permease